MRKYVFFTAIIISMISCKKEDERIFTEPFKDRYNLLVNYEIPRDRVYSLTDTIELSFQVLNDKSWYIYALEEMNFPTKNLQWPMVDSGSKRGPIVNHSFEGEWYRVSRDDMNLIKIKAWRSVQYNRSHNLNLYLTDDQGGSDILYLTLIPQ